MKKAIDIYLRRPILVDLGIVLLAVGLIVLMEVKYSINLPALEKVKGLSNEIGGASITIAGFVLTILALLITFKHDYREMDSGTETRMSIFFNSPLYFKAVKLYKDAVIVLVVIFVLLLSLQFFESEKIQSGFKYFSLSSLILTAITFIRCIFILSLVIKLQEEKDSEILNQSTNNSETE